MMLMKVCCYVNKALAQYKAAKSKRASVNGIEPFKKIAVRRDDFIYMYNKITYNIYIYI